MQTEPTKSLDQEPSTKASASQQSITQDGFRSPEQGSLDGASQPGLNGLLSGRAANGASPVLKGGNTVRTGAEQPQSGSHEGHYTLPGERVSAYEHATTPSAPAGFKVTKRPDPSSEGPSLTDCPNGV
jgi:hypothetical protein